MKKETPLKKIMSACTIVITIIIFLFIFYALKKGFFDSNDLLVEQIKTFGPIGPLFFVFLQIVQVIFPVIPGGASCLAGVLAFGPIAGFFYNYIGLCLGSVFAFCISKRYGLALIKKLFAEETIEKYLKYIKSKRFEQVFFLGILLPAAPDDLLCYIAGISGISNKRFLTIILLCKPFTLLLYSCFIEYFLL